MILEELRLNRGKLLTDRFPMASRLRFSVAFALMLSIWVPPTSCQNWDWQTSYANMDGVGTTQFKGSKLRVFELEGGVQVAEPRVGFSGSCSTLRYNRVYLRYQLTVPLQVDTETLARPLSGGKKLGKLTVTKIELRLDAGLADKRSKVTALTVGKPGGWKLAFLCDTFARCTGLNDELLTNPWSLQQTLQFSAIGTVGSSPVRFSATSSANPLHLEDCHRNRWFDILRRVDGNLSFKKNWDDYVKGFGHPRSNFWIGLESLFAITATKQADVSWNNPETALCRMRMEAEGMDGKKYWSEYGRFQVMGADQNYQLRVGDEKPGSTIKRFIDFHNEKQFSTYDRDHDANPKMSCSRVFGFGGFWYGNCHHENPTAVMTSKKIAASNFIVTYQSLVAPTGWVQTKKVTMQLKCE